MYKIFCNPSPFVFNPINDLLQQINWRPEELDDYLALYFLNPTSQKYKMYRQHSHLTDAQSREDQLRFLGNSEVDRKLLHLARTIVQTVDGQKIVFAIEPNFHLHEKLLFFINNLNIYSSQIAEIIFEPKHHKVQQMSSVETLYFSSPKQRAENAEKIINIAKDCIHAANYWTAINFLLSIRDLDLPPAINAEVMEQLALSYRAVDAIFEAKFYNEALIRVGNLNQRKKARYSLAMLHTRNFPNKFKSLDIAADYLNVAYKELSEAEYDEATKGVDMVFNRNGYALVLFRKGKVDEATTIVENGIAKLDLIDTASAKFHQSVLFYNLFQCYVAQKQYDKAADTLKGLLEKDHKYHPYYVHLANFYIRQDNPIDALVTLEKGIGQTPSFYLFHYIKGTILYETEDKAAAIESFKTALHLNPYDFKSLAHLTNLYNAQGAYEEVAALTQNFEFAYNNHPHGATIFNNKLIAMLNDGSITDPDVFNKMVLSFERLNPDSTMMEGIVTDEMKTLVVEETLFDDWAKNYERDVYQMNKQYPFAGYFDMVTAIGEQINSHKNCQLLDLGVGTGLMLSLLQDQCSFDFQGLDFSEKMVHYAKQRLACKNIYKWNIASDELPESLKDKTFDMILSSFTLHHFDNPKKLEIINRYFQLLRPTGSFIIADISFDNSEYFQQTKTKEGERWDVSEESGYFIKEQFIRFLEKHNYHFQYIKMTYCTGIYLINKNETKGQKNNIGKALEEMS